MNRTRWHFGLASTLLLFFALSLASPCFSGTLQLKVGPNGCFMRKEIQSVKELRYKNIVRQGLDYSCGSAALATIIKYYYGRNALTEQDIVKDILEKGDDARIKDKGFSLLDLKQYAERQGFRAEAYKIEADQLSQLSIPIIVLMEVKNYKHFVVLKGVKNNKVYLGDPAYGHRVVKLEEFSKSWNNIFLAVLGTNPDKDLYKLHQLNVSKKDAWSLRQTALPLHFMTRPFEMNCN